MMPTRQLNPQIQTKTLEQMRAEVKAFLPQIPARLQKRTYDTKNLTGRHSTLLALQKYTRELFKATYKTPFEALPVMFQGEIIRMVADVHYGMKEARAYE